jgi:hypothetical protein
MDDEERRIIEELFGKLAEVERRSGLREPEADALVARLAARQPGAAYYMAQAIVAQEWALGAAQARITELEQRAPAPQSSGGFLSGLFGVPSSERTPREASPREFRPAQGAGGPWGASPGYGGGPGYGRSGGGFLAGAAQTAVGVAGGVMLGSFLTDMLTPDAAMASEVGIDEDGFGGEGDPGFSGSEDTGEAPDTGDMGDLGSDLGDI